MNQGPRDPAPLVDVHAEAARDESAALFPLDPRGRPVHEGRTSLAP